MTPISKLTQKSHDACFSTSSMCLKMLGSSIVGVTWKEKWRYECTSLKPFHTFHNKLHAMLDSPLFYNTHICKCSKIGNFEPNILKCPSALQNDKTNCPVSKTNGPQCYFLQNSSWDFSMCLCKNTIFFCTCTTLLLKYVYLSMYNMQKNFKNSYAWISLKFPKIIFTQYN